ncbi:MAG: DUF4091 domain-containing protein [Armatimonadetes bacterium]|nr:DUF4091 domain-containing protein [Armatimonadota bacterium]
MVADLGAVIRLARAVDPAIPVYASTWHHVPGWDGLLNHWGVGQYGCFPLDKLHERQAAGDKVWLTVDGQLELDTPFNACERMLSYYCFAHGLSGFEHWALAWYTDDPYRFGWYGYLFHRFSPERTSWVRYPSGSGHLAYPGPNGEPVSTIRLENVRLGLEDYEVLAALRRLKPAKPADRAAVAKVLAEVAKLCAIPNAGGYRSTEILPAPERLTELRVRAGALVEALTP